MHRRVKFRQDQPTRCGDITIFRYFKMPSIRHLGLFGAYLDHPQRVLGGLYYSANSGYDRHASFDNMKVSIFGAFGLKTPITPQNRSIGGIGPLNHGAAILTKLPKRHPLRDSA